MPRRLAPVPDHPDGHDAGADTDGAAFYGPALPVALRPLWAAARRLQGLDAEIALLRLRLRALLLAEAGEPELQKAVDALVKAVTAAGRLPAQESTAESLAQVSEELSGILAILAADDESGPHPPDPPLPTCVVMGGDGRGSDGEHERGADGGAA